MGHEGSNTTAREHKVSVSKGFFEHTPNYKDALRRLAQTQHDRKGEASCLGTTKVLLVNGELDVEERSSGDLLLLDSNVDCSGRSGKTVKKIKAGEYLIYPRVLRPATKLLCIINGYGEGCIVDCKIEIQG